jgi:hypothetical protein
MAQSLKWLVVSLMMETRFHAGHMQIFLFPSSVGDTQPAGKVVLVVKYLSTTFTEAYGVEDVQIHVFLTSAVVRNDYLGRFTFGKERCTHR